MNVIGPYKGNDILEYKDKIQSNRDLAVKSWCNDGNSHSNIKAVTPSDVQNPKITMVLRNDEVLCEPPTTQRRGEPYICYKRRSGFEVLG